jgi:CRP/FNR family transcriptional regulator, cyclic AMP receptor protein
MLSLPAMASPGTELPPTFLDALTAEEAADLRSRAVTRRFRRGATLMSQGEAPGRVLAIERGRAKVTAITDDGRELVLAFSGPGDLLGELSALGGSPRVASVRAIEPLAALAIASRDFELFLDANPRVALVILRVVIARLRDADRQQVEFAAYQTVTRVARRLIELAERYGEEAGGAIRIDLPISQEELAGWAGASREAITKALRDLRDAGLIETRRRHITVLDAKLLGELAELRAHS